jgi:AmmeMemoRadiSam system protein B
MFEGNIPKLRKDIDLQIIDDGEDRGILLYDKRQFAEVPLLLKSEFFLILSVIEEGITEDELRNLFLKEAGISDISPILETLKVLNDNLFLESDRYFQKLREDNQAYNMLPSRPLITAGRSYPEDPDEFNKFMWDLFDTRKTKDLNRNATAIIVPHIDLSLKGYCHHVYSMGYDAIAETNFDTIVILGTSHYTFSDYFMLTKKPYNTPLGMIENDDEVLDYLEKNYPHTFTFDDQAHRFEHSIEYQAVLSRYYFRNRNFKIVPILVGTFQQFVQDKKQPISDDIISQFIKGLKESLHKANRHPIFIASVDFSHIGMKFGDEFDAKDKLEQCKFEDYKLLDSIRNMNKEEFFNEIIATQDAWKVCGVSPIYTLLSLIDAKSGSFLEYNQWYEEATKSSVSFSSMAFYS